jgi:homoserine kinase
VTVVRVPASTANLGPGFDALGMALSITAEVGVVDDSTDVDDLVAAVDEHHPASIAFAAAGGSGELWVRSPIPMGRGMGYSGAMRVAGAALALAQHQDGVPERF